MVISIGGVVLLSQQGEALLQHRDNKPGLNAAGLWVFPGGHCEDGESVQCCARREFREETGYDCAGLVPLTAFEFRVPETGQLYQLNFFWCEYDGRQVIHCYEGQAVEFIARERAVGYPKPEYLLDVWDLALAARRSLKKERLYGKEHTG